MNVAVIGGGVMGAATAWRLAARGVDVTLHEQFGPGHVRGSSHGGSRIFRFAYDVPEYVGMARAALDGWRELEADAGETLLDITGGVDHGPAHEIERLSASMRSMGAPHEVLTGPEAEARFPGMRFDERVLVHPDGGRCRAGAAVAALQRLVDTRYDTRIASVTDQGVVTGLAKGKATITATADGKRAEAVVTVADAIVQSIRMSPDRAAGERSREQGFPRLARRSLA